MNLSEYFGGAPPPWEALAGSHGYLAPGGPVVCSREELVRVCEEQSVPHLVWTADSGGLVAPEDVPFLLAAIRRRLVRSARARTFAFALVGGVVVWSEASRSGIALGSPAALYAAMAAVLVGLTLHAWIHAARLTPTQFRQMAARAVQSAHVLRRPVVQTRWVVGMMIASGVAQVLALLNGAPDFGAIPGAVSADTVLAQGDWTRLLTAAFVHYGPLHFGVNFIALVALGRETEMFAGRGLFPLVFLLSILGGSALGVALPPDVPSVGNSGGLVGVIAFLGILAWRRPGQVPPGFLNSILINLAMLAGIGIFGYGFIDNAGHAGGGIVGALLGLAIIPRASAREAWEPGRTTRLTGDAALGVLAAACAWTVWRVVSQTG